MLIPNDNYCKFHDWLQPILDTLLEEQKTQVDNYLAITMVAIIEIQLQASIKYAYTMYDLCLYFILRTFFTGNKTTCVLFPIYQILGSQKQSFF